MDLRTNHIDRLCRANNLRDIRHMLVAAFAVVAVYSVPVWICARLIFLPGIVVFIGFAVFSFVTLNHYRRNR